MKEKQNYVKKEPIKEGDFVTAEFIKNQRPGRKPIIIVDGMIGFVSREYKGEFLQEHSVWQLEVTEVKENILVVMPVQKIKTPKQNLKEIDANMKVLAKKFTPIKGKTTK